MRSNKSFQLFMAVSVLALSACGSSSSNNANGSACTDSSGGTTIPTSSTNSIPLFIADSSTTGQYGYQNEPLVSVTICTPNHTSSSQCQTISNILLDTGSSGLRVFGSAINTNVVQLTQATISTAYGSENLAQCAVFGTGGDWGPVQNGDIVMGGQTAVNMPIQVINIAYGSAAASQECAQEAQSPLDSDPCTSGYNGILGVAPYVADCGTDCTSTNDAVNPGNYFGCDSSGCYDASDGNCSSDGYCVFAVPTSQQVTNPVAYFSSGYNNGISIDLPQISSSGSSAVVGTLTLGIPNTTTVGSVFPVDPNGQTDYGINFDTTFNGTLYGYQSTNSTQAFIDSGSNALYYPGGLTVCSDDSSSFCPASTQNLSATMAGYQGTSSTAVAFSVGNADALINTNNSAFNNLAGPDSSFDWGLPVFFGRTIYVGIENTTATINNSSVTGPYWAF